MWAPSPPLWWNIPIYSWNCRTPYRRFKTESFLVWHLGKPRGKPLIQSVSDLSKGWLSVILGLLTHHDPSNFLWLTWLTFFFTWFLGPWWFNKSMAARINGGGQNVRRKAIYCPFCQPSKVCFPSRCPNCCWFVMLFNSHVIFRPWSSYTYVIATPKELKKKSAFRYQCSKPKKDRNVIHQEKNIGFHQLLNLGNLGFCW